MEGLKYEIFPKDIVQREFETIDNGGRPFRVVLGNNIEIFARLDEDSSDEDESKNDSCKETSIMVIDQIETVFVGYDSLNQNESLGNSILIRLKDDEYVYVGNCVLRFKSFSKIVSFRSPITNSDVSLAYAIDDAFRVYQFYYPVSFTQLTKEIVDKFDDHCVSIFAFQNCPKMDMKELLQEDEDKTEFVDEVHLAHKFRNELVDVSKFSDIIAKQNEEKISGQHPLFFKKSQSTVPTTLIFERM